MAVFDDNSRYVRFASVYTVTDRRGRQVQALTAAAVPRQNKPNTVISILAPSGNRAADACLVRGPVTQVKFAVMLGVAGSWVEIHGEDRRVEMNRACIQAAWRGLASTAASQILTAHGFKPDVEPTTKLYSDADHTLNQRGTDLDFLEQIARETGYELWLEYDVTPPAPTPGAPIAIIETAKLQASPPRNAGPAP